MEVNEVQIAPIAVDNLLEQIVNKGFLVTLRLDLDQINLVYVTVGLKDKGATFHGNFKQCVLWCSDWCEAVV